jgi:hypothetical protein
VTVWCRSLNWRARSRLDEGRPERDTTNEANSIDLPTDAIKRVFALALRTLDHSRVRSWLQTSRLNLASVAGGLSQGYVTTMPPPASVRTFNSKRR